MTVCGKCGEEVYGRATKKGNHPICRKRAGHKKVVRVRMDRDVDATDARRFSDPRSYVACDGRDVLCGKDYDRRKREVLERDGYKCQWVVIARANPTTCAGAANNNPHHRVKRSKGRDDRAANLIAICDIHHKMAHPEFQTRFSKK